MGEAVDTARLHLYAHTRNRIALAASNLFTSLLTGPSNQVSACEGYLKKAKGYIPWLFSRLGHYNARPGICARHLTQLLAPPRVLLSPRRITLFALLRAPAQRACTGGSVNAALATCHSLALAPHRKLDRVLSALGEKRKPAWASCSAHTVAGASAPQAALLLAQRFSAHCAQVLGLAAPLAALSQNKDDRLQASCRAVIIVAEAPNSG